MLLQDLLQGGHLGIQYGNHRRGSGGLQSASAGGLQAVNGRLQAGEGGGGGLASLVGGLQVPGQLLQGAARFVARLMRLVIACGWRSRAALIQLVGPANLLGGLPSACGSASGL